MFTCESTVFRHQAAAAAAAIDPAHHHQCSSALSSGRAGYRRALRCLSHTHSTHIFVRSHCNRRRRSKTEKKKKKPKLGAPRSRRADRLAPPGWCRTAGVRLITPGRPLPVAGRQTGRGGRYLWSGAGLLIAQGVHLPH